MIRESGLSSSVSFHSVPECINQEKKQIKAFHVGLLLMILADLSLMKSLFDLSLESKRTA